MLHKTTLGSDLLYVYVEVEGLFEVTERKKVTHLLLTEL